MLTNGTIFAGEQPWGIVYLPRSNSLLPSFLQLLKNDGAFAGNEGDGDAEGSPYEVGRPLCNS